MTVRNIILGSILLLIVFSIGWGLGYKGYKASIARFPQVNLTREVPVDKKNLDFNLFWRVWDTVSSKYYDKNKIIPSEMVYGAIKGMVSAIGDPYTVYLPPNENKIVQEDLSGSFEGVGIQIGFKGNQLVVIAPLPGSPAEKAGIKAGDFIIGIKDEMRKIDRSTVGITLPEAVQVIRGKSGSKVTLTLLREGQEEPIVVDIIRRTIDVPSITKEYLDDGRVVHIKILKFSRETLDEWEKVVTEIVAEKDLQGVILDVRNNPGGFLDDAVEIASDFLNTGDVVVVEVQSGGGRNEYRAQKIGRLKNLRTVVLINEGSASASEILAGALRDDKKIKLVGETTFGKGTIQEPIEIDGNGGLHVTIAKWLTPSGFWVNEVGLKPDLEVKDNPDTSQDEQLEKGLEIIKS